MLGLRLTIIVALALPSLACDGDNDNKEAAAKGKDAKGKDAEGKDAEAAPEAGKDGKDGEPTADAETHFDASHDKSGILARSAGALESRGIDNEDLRDLSHHAEKLPTAADLCKHILGIKKGDDQAACETNAEHHMVQVGPELYGEWATCVLASKTAAELDACEAGEKAVEGELHDKPHGENLPEEDCTRFFEQFEKLAMADAGDQAELVKTTLEEVRADVVTACREQGSKAELECAMKAKTMHELNECAAALL